MIHWHWHWGQATLRTATLRTRHWGHATLRTRLWRHALRTRLWGHATLRTNIMKCLSSKKKFVLKVVCPQSRVLKVACPQCPIVDICPCFNSLSSPSQCELARNVPPECGDMWDITSSQWVRALSPRFSQRILSNEEKKRFIWKKQSLFSSWSLLIPAVFYTGPPLKSSKYKQVNLG